MINPARLPALLAAAIAAAILFSSAASASSEIPMKQKLEQLSRASCPPGMAFIPPGAFDMGCSFDDTQCQPDERPVVHVYITRPFCMSRLEVTEDQFTKVMKTAIRYNHRCGFDCPATNVTWNQASEYCAKTGGRLPTEAEWEYSARALTTTRFHWGSNINGKFAWFNKNSNGVRRPVGKRLPNKFGLHDTIGNAWEWVRDCYNETTYHRMPHEDPSFDRSGCEERVLRGGAGYADEVQLRVSKRIANDPGYTNEFFGFRCAADIK